MTTTPVAGTATLADTAISGLAVNLDVAREPLKSDLAISIAPGIISTSPIISSLPANRLSQRHPPATTVPPIIAEAPPTIATTPPVIVETPPTTVSTAPIITTIPPVATTLPLSGITSIATELPLESTTIFAPTLTLSSASNVSRITGAFGLFGLGNLGSTTTSTSPTAGLAGFALAHYLLSDLDLSALNTQANGQATTQLILAVENNQIDALTPAGTPGPGLLVWTHPQDIGSICIATSNTVRALSPLPAALIYMVEIATINGNVIMNAETSANGLVGISLDLIPNLLYRTGSVAIIGNVFLGTANLPPRPIGNVPAPMNTWTL